MTVHDQVFVRACLALGSNLGDRRAQILRAVRDLKRAPGVRVIAVSELIRTEAVAPEGSGPQPSYLNGAALIETSLPPRELLDLLLRLEREAGRERKEGERWGPRTLDLDLLIYSDEVIDEPGLTVPHPRMHERRFVLTPLVQIAPDERHPVLKRTVRELLEALPEEKGIEPPAIPQSDSTGSH